MVNSRQSARRASREQGYILLVLLVSVALLAIGAAAIAPTIAFQMKRDREEEMIHRGVQYSRAIRRYYKKFGRYPTRIEDLENTNNLRFLRRRYKDPITGQDFKLLHLGEVKLNFPGGIAGAAAIGANQSGLNAAGLNTSAGPGGRTGGIGLAGTASAGPQVTPPQMTAPQASEPAQGDQLAGSSSPAGQNPDQSTQGSSSQSSSPASGSSSSKQVFGGGPIVGVVSASTDATIRVFNDKKHYNEWQFIFDPSTDRGGLLTAPGLPSGGVSQTAQPAPGSRGTQPGQGGNEGQQPAPQGNQDNNDND